MSRNLAVQRLGSPEIFRFSYIHEELYLYNSGWGEERHITGMSCFECLIIVIMEIRDPIHHASMCFFGKTFAVCFVSRCEWMFGGNRCL